MPDQPPTNRFLESISYAVAIVGGLVSLISHAYGHRIFAVRVIAVIQIAVGSIVLLGWAMNEPALYTIPRDTTAMAPLTAILFFIGGCSHYTMSTMVKENTRKLRNGGDSSEL